MFATLEEAGCVEKKSTRRWKTPGLKFELVSCPDRAGVDCAKVTLRNGRIMLMDASDWVLIGKYKICFYSYGYALCSAFRKCPNTSGVVHRMVAALVYGGVNLRNQEGGRISIDHINGNGLDNRRCNLRLCNHAQNMRNQSSVKGSSRFKGVYQSQTPGKWKATVTYTRPGFPRSIHLGTFSTEEEAARAYDSKVIEFFGEFAKTNQNLGLY